MTKTEVILQDFDGSRTIFPAELPLERVIHSAQSDMEVTVDKSYVRTDQADDRGRPIYVEMR